VNSTGNGHDAGGDVEPSPTKRIKTETPLSAQPDGESLSVIEIDMSAEGCVQHSEQVPALVDWAAATAVMTGAAESLVAVLKDAIGNIHSEDVRNRWPTVFEEHLNSLHTRMHLTVMANDEFAGDY
jgi:hypothetical protein